MLTNMLDMTTQYTVMMVMMMQMERSERFGLHTRQMSGEAAKYNYQTLRI